MQQAVDGMELPSTQINHENGHSVILNQADGSKLEFEKIHPGIPIIQGTVMVRDIVGGHSDTFKGTCGRSRWQRGLEYVSLMLVDVERTAQFEGLVKNGAIVRRNLHR